MAGIEYKPTTSQVASVADYFNGASSNLARGIQNFGSGFGSLGDIVSTTQTNKALDEILSQYDPNNPTATSAAIKTALANRPDISPEMRMYMNTTLRDNLFKSADQENLYNAKRAADALQNEVNAQLANANIAGLNKANLALRDSGLRSDALQFGDKDKLLNSAADRDLKGTSANLNRAKLKDQEDLRFANDVTAALTTELFNLVGTKQYASPELLNAELWKAAQAMSAGIPGLDGLDSAVRLKAIETAIAKTKQYIDAGYQSAYPIQDTNGAYAVKRRNLATGKDTTYNVPYEIFIPGVSDPSMQGKEPSLAPTVVPTNKAAALSSTIASNIGTGDFTPEVVPTAAPVGANTPVPQQQVQERVSSALQAAGRAAPAALPTTGMQVNPPVAGTPVQVSPANITSEAVGRAISSARTAPPLAAAANEPIQTPAGPVTPAEAETSAAAVAAVDERVDNILNNLSSTFKGMRESGPVPTESVTALAEQMKLARSAQQIIKTSQDPEEINNARQILEDIDNKAAELANANNNNNNGNYAPIASAVTVGDATDSTNTSKVSSPTSEKSDAEKFTDFLITSRQTNNLGANTNTNTNKTKTESKSEPEAKGDFGLPLWQEVALRKVLAASPLTLPGVIAVDAALKANTPMDAGETRINALQQQGEEAKAQVDALKAQTDKNVEELKSIDFSQKFTPEMEAKTTSLVQGTLANYNSLLSFLNSSLNAEARGKYDTDLNFAAIQVNDTLKDGLLAFNGFTVDSGDPSTAKDLGIYIGGDKALTSANIAAANNNEIVKGFVDSLEGRWSWTNNEKKELFGSFNRIQSQIYNALSAGSANVTNPATGTKVTTFTNEDALKYSKMLALSIMQTASEDYTGTIFKGGQGDYDYNQNTAKKLTNYCINAIRNPNSSTAKTIVELGKVTHARDNLANSYGAIAQQKENIAKQEKLIDPNDPFALNSIISGSIYNRMNNQLPTMYQNLRNSFLETYNMFR